MRSCQAVMFVLVFLVGRKEGEWVRRRVFAAEFVFAWWCRREGEVVWLAVEGGSNPIVVVVEKKVVQGFAGDLATVNHHVQISEKFNFGNAFPQHEEDDTNQTPYFLGNYW